MSILDGNVENHPSSGISADDSKISKQESLTAAAVDGIDHNNSPSPLKPTSLAASTLLPSSVLREVKNVVMRNGVPWTPIFCANCGKDGGFVPEETANFAFYLCEPCGDKWQDMAGYMMVPDEVFWENVKQTQLEREGRELTADEVAEALKDDNHYLSKLAKDRPRISRR